MWFNSLLPLCFLISATFALSRDELHLLKVDLNNDNSLCRSPGSLLTEADSYNITASGLASMFCEFRVREVEGLIIRFGYGLNPGESVTFGTPGYDLVVDDRNPPFDCFFVGFDKDIDMPIKYIKAEGITPGLDFVMTEAECTDKSDENDDNDVYCSTNTCSFAGVTPYCPSVTIDSSFRCDRQQNCPFGEDETCGAITTVTPGTVTTPGSTDTTYPPPPIPSHLRAFFLSASSPACQSGPPYVVDHADSIILAVPNQVIYDVCMFEFTDTREPNDEYMLLRLNGTLGKDELLTIRNGRTIFSITEENGSGSCFVVSNTFEVGYSTRGAPMTGGWSLLLSEMDCDDDDNDSDELFCGVERCKRDTTARACITRGSIDDSNRCDGLEQCPAGEDESNCGGVTTPRPTIPPPPLPNHLNAYYLSASSAACKGGSPYVVPYDDSIILAAHAMSFQGGCTYLFSDTRNYKDNNHMLIRMNGTLSAGELLTIQQGRTIFSIRAGDGEGDCFVVENDFTVGYSTGGEITTGWSLLLTEIDCDDDYDSDDLVCGVERCKRDASVRACTTRGSIDDSNRCDGLEQCPAGEDESNCGPSSTSMTPYPTTFDPSIPSGFQQIGIAPYTSACTSGFQSFPYGAFYIYIAHPETIKINCSYFFNGLVNEQHRNDAMTILTLQGTLGISESLIITSEENSLILDHFSPERTCVVMSRGFTFNYIADRSMTTNWKIVQTPATCGGGCGVECGIHSCLLLNRDSCVNKVCLQNQYKCDGLISCPHGEDEYCGGSISTGGIVGIIIAVVVGILLIVALVLTFLSRTKRNPAVHLNMSDIVLDNEVPYTVFTDDKSSKTKAKEVIDNSDNIYETT